MAASGAPLFILSFRHRDELTATRRARRLAADRGAAGRQCREPVHRLGRVGGGGRRARRARPRARRRCGRSPIRPRPMPPPCSSCSRAAMPTALDELLRRRRHPFPGQPVQRAAVPPGAPVRPPPCRAGRRPPAARRGEPEGRKGRPDAPPGAGSRARARSSSARRWPARPGSARKTGQRISLMELFRKLDPDGRRAARGAIDRLLATGEATAFAHARRRSGGARLAHHVRVEGGGRRSSAAPRRSSRPTAPAWQSRDPMTGVRDGRAARAWIERAARAGGRGAARAGRAAARGQPLRRDQRRLRPADRRRGAPGRGAADRAAGRRATAGAGWSRGWPAPSSRPARARRPASAKAASSPASWSRRSAGRSCRATMSSPWAAGSESPRPRPGDDAAGLAAPGQRRARRGQGRARAAPVRVLEAGAAERQRARRPARGRSAPRARPGRDRDPASSRRSRSTSGGSSAPRRSPAGATRAIGELGAMTLFSVAERSDYLVQLSDHVQRKAIAAAAAWPEALAAPAPVGQHHRRRHRPPGLRRAVPRRWSRESGFDPGRLTVEVTESGLIEDLAAAGNLLAQLREGGLRVAIDDFGTGYSSLAYLKALPLDYLKIDKRLCEDITGSPARPGRGAQRHRHGALARPRGDRRRGGDRGAARPARAGGLHPLPGLPLLAAGRRGDLRRWWGRSLS